MTQLRKEINKELADKLLLKDASVWQISICLFKKLLGNIWFWVILSAVELVIIWVKLVR